MLNFDFFSNKFSDLYSPIKDASFGILKSIIGEILFFGFYKGVNDILTVRGEVKQ